MFERGPSKAEIAELKRKLSVTQDRSDLLDEACGVGLWEAFVVDGDPLHPQNSWSC